MAMKGSANVYETSATSEAKNPKSIANGTAGKTAMFANSETTDTEPMEAIRSGNTVI